MQASIKKEAAGGGREFSFRNIEAIRGQFHDALIPIDQTLAEIERTKVVHAEARSPSGVRTSDRCRNWVDYGPLAARTLG